MVRETSERTGKSKRVRLDDDSEEYTVDVNCKECGLHFDDFDNYREHLKQHFEKDPEREWRMCLDLEPSDTDCDLKRKWKSDQSFIAHLCAFHGYDRLFWCNLYVYICLSIALALMLRTTNDLATTSKGSKMDENVNIHQRRKVMSRCI